jgi:ectoine hydroxylase-related dioxygenase (phytanoyl-CoA dioxygenase family)
VDSHLEEACVRDDILKNKTIITPYIWNKCLINNQQKIVNTFNKNGLIIIPHVISGELCDEIFNEIQIIMNNKMKKYNNAKSLYKRFDIILSLDKFKKYILKIYNKLKYFFDTITPKPKLLECSSFITEPECLPQSWHTDTILDKINKNEEDKYANFITVSLSLNDIDESNSPLEGYLDTHKLTYDVINEKLKKYNISEKYDEIFLDKNCKYYNNNEKRGLCENYGLVELNNIEKKYKHVKCVSPKGSLTIWSSKIFHRGGANTGNINRNIFYFSLIGNNGVNPVDYDTSLEEHKKLDDIYLEDLY